VLVQGGQGSLVRFKVADWARTNLGELREENGRLVPVRPEGY
jgi:hypothetical protein